MSEKYTRRAELPPLERAVSDTLDEYLTRLHGILATSWAYPIEFIEWLEERGYCIKEIEKGLTHDTTS